MSNDIIKGQFKTKTKFIEFIGGKGFINFISNEAIIDGNQLSGLEMDGIRFKLTICDDMSVNFDEIDTNMTTESQRARLVEIIEDKTISSYRSRSVVHELDFVSVTKFKDKSVPLYLAVEVEKPIDRLSSMLNDTLQATESALDNLDSLINSWLDDDDFLHDVTSTDENDKDFDDKPMEKPIVDITKSMEDSFASMKEEKLQELKKSKSKKEFELSSYENQLSTLGKNIETTKTDIKLLEDRIDDLQPIEPPTGYYFFVSERQNETITLDESTEKIIRDKVSKVKSINLDNFMKLFTDGEFHIKLGEKKDDGFENLEDYTKLPDEILAKLNQLNLSIDKDKFVYNGELIWSQIVNKLIKLGFEENADFNKLCGSNSYQSNTESKEEVKTKKTKF
jgi:hypothetical protein